VVPQQSVEVEGIAGVMLGVTNGITVSLLLSMWRVTASAGMAAIALTARLALPNLVLLNGSLALWSFHGPYFTQSLRHSLFIMLLLIQMV
jgi:hypothetical protein